MNGPQTVTAVSSFAESQEFLLCYRLTAEGTWEGEGGLAAPLPTLTRQIGGTWRAAAFQGVLRDGRALKQGFLQNSLKVAGAKLAFIRLPLAEQR